MNLLFIDLETTGLIPQKHEIIDICMVETDREGEIVKEFYTKVKPSILGVDQADLKALEVNKFNWDKWKDAPDWYEVIPKIGDHFDLNNELKFIPIGWNIWFDLQFLQDWLTHFYIKKLTYHPLDLMSFAWSSVSHLSKPKLIDAYEYLTNSKKEEEHTARGDVNMMIELYRWWR